MCNKWSKYHVLVGNKLKKKRYDTSSTPSTKIRRGGVSAAAAALFKASSFPDWVRRQREPGWAPLHPTQLSLFQDGVDFNKTSKMRHCAQQQIWYEVKQWCFRSTRCGLNQPIKASPKSKYFFLFFSFFNFRKWSVRILAATWHVLISLTFMDINIINIFA